MCGIKNDYLSTSYHCDQLFLDELKKEVDIENNAYNNKKFYRQYKDGDFVNNRDFQ